MTRKFQSIWAILVGVIASLTLAACDDDVSTSYDLDGIWQGEIRGDYYTDRYHYADRWDTEIQFVQDGYAGGYGTEVDYSYYYNRAYRSDFTWEVRNGYIYLYYSDGYNAVIADYELYSSITGTRFRGVFQDMRTGRPMANFDLVKVADWGPYSRTALTE